ncbi:hypothetical protein [Cellvibrio sp.]|uniref:hypothetical protein n=1 Tax=Cellvibrio sp. TaxID=1965322 RepID=UPI0039648091
MPKERILITVKTYPTLSSKYDEVVCTAGLREDGTWVRLYPIPFRKLDEIEQYKKFDIVEVDLEKNKSDPRPESYRIKTGIKIVGHIDTQQQWFERCQRVLFALQVYDDFGKLIEANKSEENVSLATFKPASIKGLLVEEDIREWDAGKLEMVRLRGQQNQLFADNDKVFSVVRKLPYKFKYVFTDSTGRERTMSISDWELGALFWKELQRFGGDESKAVESVRHKYLVELVNQRNIHFFVGTTQVWDSQNAPNPFMIIGVFSPPLILQSALF